MTMKTLKRSILVAALAAAANVCAQEPSLLPRACASMRKAGEYWATRVASHGGYVWEYSTDFVTRRRGEGRDLPLTTNWVQPPGTPTVGMTFVRAYEATGEKLYLDAAVAAAHCLAWGQLDSGGWTYSIEFDPKRNRQRYHHLVEAKAPNVNRLRNTTTFDDNNTQSATRLLMAVDRHVDDPVIDKAVERALKCFLAAQYKDGPWDGAWPQRYPPPSKGYGRYPTFNDGTMSDCVRTMLAAYKQYEKQEYLDSVKRCMEFYLRSQQPAPQSAWAQQYDENLKPAWARRFEPPSITGGESSGNMQLLMDMYIELGDERYMSAVGKAIEWYKRSRIGGTEKKGVWARFYEPETDRPLYFTRKYKLVYTDDDLPIHYSFKSNYGVNKRMRYYEQVKERGREYYLEKRSHRKTPEQWRAGAKGMERGVRSIIDQQDELGRWVKVVVRREQARDKERRVVWVVDESTKLHMMYSRTFDRNMRRLADYVAAAQGGPKVVRESAGPNAPAKK